MSTSRRKAAPVTSYRISQTLPVKNTEFTEEKARQYLFEEEIRHGPFLRTCFGNCGQRVSSDEARKRELTPAEVSIALTGMCAPCWENTAIPENNMTYEQKLAKWRGGYARFPAPPVCTAQWTEASWIEWVDQKGVWL